LQPHILKLEMPTTPTPPHHNPVSMENDQTII
jgi:hypothetical protein